MLHPKKAIISLLSTTPSVHLKFSFKLIEGVRIGPPPRFLFSKKELKGKVIVFIRKTSKKASFVKRKPFFD